MVDPRSPVVVGVGQSSQRVPVESARAPMDLFEEAARNAEADAGVAMLPKVDIVAVAQIVSWPYPDPGAFLARRLGITPRATAVSTIGGNSPLLLLHEFASRIQNNECDVVLLGGTECVYTRWRARREPKFELTWELPKEPQCEWVIGDDRAPSTDYEMVHGATAPTNIYPLFETALRAEAGRSVADHQHYIGELWSRFANVAADNPNAWTRERYTADDIATVTPDNRAVVFPYVKRMNANIDVDQSAAVILCAYETARAAGVSDDRMVFLHGASEAKDHWFVSERWSFTESPAIAAAFEDASQVAGISNVDVFDLYSCFPSAVQVGANAVKAGSQPLTVTGGLGFAGGPANNYPTHAIARMVETLRAHPDAFGCTTALGWYITKHAVSIWSARPPDHGFQKSTGTQDRVDAQPKREVAGLIDGDATIEATAVPFERDGSPMGATCTLLTDDGRRVFAQAPNHASAFTDDAWEGRRVRIGNDGSVNRVQE